MLIRFLGASLLLTVCVRLCMSLSRAERDRVRQTEGFLLLLRHIRSCISCYRTPLREIWSGFENRALAECGFLARLRRDGFAAALLSVKGRLYLDAEELRLLTAFACEIGKGRSQEQITLCNYTVERLESYYAKRVEEEPRRRRTANSLVIIGGLMLILVLL